MDLRRTLVGAFAGAAVGVALHLILVAIGRVDAGWFAIVVGLLTGLGVRQANKSAPATVSYTRGGLAAVVALLAVIATVLLAPIVREKTAKAGPVVTRSGSGDRGAAGEDPAGEPTGEEEAPAGEATVEEQAPAGEATLAAKAPSARAPAAKTVEPAPEGGFMQFFDIWQFIFVAVGVFLAYELARGAGGKPAATTTSA